MVSVELLSQLVSSQYGDPGWAPATVRLTVFPKIPSVQLAQNTSPNLLVLIPARQLIIVSGFSVIKLEEELITRRRC